VKYLLLILVCGGLSFVPVRCQSTQTSLADAAVSRQCSEQADQRQLHDDEHWEFRAQCKAAARLEARG
jgi:hypothetical protein